ncbi:MAG: hypothetical protein JRD68_01130 [Deltaproteobacteria bacterium]|nr:hypothetical protein [Deltaproteobacteria bacterium]
MLRRNILIMILTTIIGLGLSISGCSLRKDSSRVYYNKSGLKKRIAVLPFQEYPNYKGEPLGRRVAAALANSLSQSGKVMVVPLKEVEDYISAQRIPTPLTQTSAVMVGRGLHLNAMVLGTISEIDAVSGKGRYLAYIPFIKGSGSITVGLVGKVVDAGDGTLLLAETSKGDTKYNPKEDSWASGSEKGLDKALVDRSLDQATRAMSKSILKALAKSPWKGFVIRVSGNTVLVSAGKEEGVNLGDRFVILSVQEKITGATGISYVIPGPAKATLEVTRVLGNSSEAKIISGRVLPGEAIYPID